MMIEHYLNQINLYLQLHTYLGGLFSFIVSLTESLPLIGTIVPGSLTMTVIGVLVGRGMISFNTTLFWAIIGALTGDTIGFWIGKIYNERLRDMWPFKKHPQWLTMGKTFFQKHGGKSILIGRFVGPARSTVPLIAGLLKMSWGRFFVAAIPSAVMWAIAYILPGVLIGAISLEIPHGMATKFIFTGLLIIVILWLIFWAIQRFFMLIVFYVNKTIDRIWNWLNRRHSSKYLIRIITNKVNPDDHHQLTLILLAFLCLLCFLAILICIFIYGSPNQFNNAIFYFLQSIRSHSGNNFFAMMTILGDKRVIFTIAGLTAIGLSMQRQWRPFFHLVLITLVTSVIIEAFKWVLYSPRPGGFVIANTSSSFPSGHTAFSLAIFGFLSFLTAQQFSRKWHWIPYTITSILVALIGLSRLYLGAHWMTDILASVFLSFIILLLTIIAYRRYSPPAFSQLAWPIIVVLAVSLSWAGYSAVLFKSIMEEYEPYSPTQEISIHEWWNNPLQYLPIYRLDRLGNPIQPFNVQWAAPLNDIKQNLLGHGWQLIQSKNNVKSAIGRLASYNPENHLPILAQLYRLKPPVLFMIKHVHHSSTIIELRLWESGVQFYANLIPLWVGSVNYHAPPLRLISIQKTRAVTLNGDGGLSIVAKDNHTDQKKWIQVPTDKQPKKINPLNWNGKILLLRANLALHPSR